LRQLNNALMRERKIDRDKNEKSWRRRHDEYDSE
jgi:hypothetical protein